MEGVRYGLLLDTSGIHDSLIMESLEDKLSTEQLGMVNRCWLYLQVMWWSDITDGGGKAISKNAIKGRQEQYFSNLWKWPNQDWPNAQGWEEWVKAISVGKYRSRKGRIKLNKPLGKWHTGNHTWYYDQPGEHLLHGPTNTVWVRLPRRPTRLEGLKFSWSNIVDKDFPRSCVATITRSCVATITRNGNSAVSVDSFRKA
jgi:hypothetical protein